MSSLNIDSLIELDFLDIIDDNNEAFNFISEWIYKDGPGNDERYKPDSTPHDYIFMLYDNEIDYLQKQFLKRGWL